MRMPRDVSFRVIRTGASHKPQNAWTAWRKVALWAFTLLHCRFTTWQGNNRKCHRLFLRGVCRLSHAWPRRDRPLESRKSDESHENICTEFFRRWEPSAFRTTPEARENREAFVSANFGILDDQSTPSKNSKPKKTLTSWKTIWLFGGQIFS